MLLVLSLSLFSCTPYSAKETIPEPQYETINARITYYDSKQEHWGTQVADPNTKKAKFGVTVAAHPDFDFGTEIFISDLKGIIGNGKFIVQDRGSAVTKKKAAKKKGYVFDVYCSSPSMRKKMAKNNPMWMEVKILKK